MDTSMGLGDILQAALAEHDPQAFHQRRQTLISADALAAFLKTLPDSVNTFKLLSTITEFVGEEMATETLRSLMGIRRENGRYVLQPLGSHINTQKIAAIRAVRENTNAGLREAKNFVEGEEYLVLTADAVRKIESEVYALGFRVVNG